VIPGLVIKDSTVCQKIYKYAVSLSTLLFMVKYRYFLYCTVYYFMVIYALICFLIFHHSVWSIITAHILTPMKRDDCNVSYVCLSHARLTQNTRSITAMKCARFNTVWSALCLVTLA